MVIGLSLSFTPASVELLRKYRRRNEPLEPDFSFRPIELRSDDVLDGVVGLVGARILPSSTTRAYPTLSTGNTPLIRIASLSDALGVEILGKAEVCLESSCDLRSVILFPQYMNPGGSVKDRVALRSVIYSLHDEYTQFEPNLQ